MRPLHRPMFRYGGPIKEGVMSGIREPHAGGGRAAALVGNPVYPRTGGREHHFKNYFLNLLGIGAKGTVGTQTKKTVGTEATKGIKSLWKKYGPTWPKATRTGKLGEGKEAFEVGKGFKEIPIPKMERAGKFVKDNPWWTAGGVGVGSQYAKDALGLAEKIPLQMADLLVRDKYFDQDKWMKENYPDGFIGSLFSGKDKKEDEKKLTANELRIKQLEKLLAAKKEPAVVIPPKTAEEIRNERIQKYRDIMDIKGMNKEAAYDSLIAASQAINESGDFKGDIRSGKLINQIIQGASKAFDKPKKTKDAIDTLILKGEIEADLAKAKGSTSWQAIDALSKASGQSPQFVANAKLGIANTISEAVNNFRKVKKLPTSDDITGVVYSFSERTGIPVKKQISTEKAGEVIGRGKEYETVTDMVSALELDPNGADDGFYVIGTKVVQVTDGVPRVKA